MCCFENPWQSGLLHVKLSTPYAGEYGLIPHAAACWSDVSTTACDALSALIASHHARGTAHSSSSTLASSVTAATDSPTHRIPPSEHAVPSHSRQEHSAEESRPKRQRVADVSTHGDAEVHTSSVSLPFTHEQHSTPQQPAPDQHPYEHPQLVQPAEGGSGSGSLADSPAQQLETEMLSSTSPAAELPSSDVTVYKSCRASRVLLGVLRRFSELSSGRKRQRVRGLTGPNEVLMMSAFQALIVLGELVLA